MNYTLTTAGEWLEDSDGRKLLLRGVNLPAKMPQRLDPISFIGRPFPIEEMEEHFSRIKYLGFSSVRLGVSWEALEHAGPGIYDEDYLSYLETLVKKAEEHKILVLIDFHQDVWSRFTGGDGAPGWTLESVGFSLDNLAETGSALFFDRHSTFSPHIIWATNAYKLGAATMFTLFFGGDLFAPTREIQGESVQSFLQGHYLRFMQKIASRLKAFPNVIGYDIMNEPVQGYIGNKDLNHVFGIVKLGATPTPFQSMVLGDGNTQIIEVWDRKWISIRKVKETLVNDSKTRAWKEGASCIWKEHGIWDYDQEGIPRLLDPHYFYKKGGMKIHFNEHCYKPFLLKAIKVLQESKSTTLCFVENAIGEDPPELSGETNASLVFSTHWYDAFILVTKRFFSWIGFDMIHMKQIIHFPHFMRPAFARQIHHLKHVTKKKLGNIPLMITEFGIPFDIGNKKAYETGDFTLQNKAFNRSSLAIEDNLISSMIWNYTCHNCNVRGDDWNEEDLSIFSKDQQKNPSDPYSGIRAKESIIRPYAIRTPGLPTHMHFNWLTGRFDFSFINNPSIKSPLEIFLPDLHYKSGFQVDVTDGSYEMDYARQLLTYHPARTTLKHTLRITKT